MKLLPSSAAKQFILRSITTHIKYSTFRKRCYLFKLMFNSFTKLTKILKKKIQCNRFYFILMGVQEVLRFLVSIRDLRQYEKLNILKNILQYAKLFRIKKCLVDDVSAFLELSLFNNASLPNIYYLMKWIGDLT